MSKNLKAYNIFDLRELALKRIPKGLFELVDRGTEDEVSLRNNRTVFERIRLKPRTLVDVSRRNQDTTIFGVKHKAQQVRQMRRVGFSQPCFSPSYFLIAAVLAKCTR